MMTAIRLLCKGNIASVSKPQQTSSPPSPSALVPSNNGATKGKSGDITEQMTTQTGRSYG